MTTLSIVTAVLSGSASAAAIVAAQARWPARRLATTATASRSPLRCVSLMSVLLGKVSGHLAPHAPADNTRQFFRPFVSQQSKPVAVDSFGNAIASAIASIINTHG